ncbi:MAG: FecR domain-containing protein [Hyphomicrobiaceae bacterium]|nr:FecR domain-containing protein [Hyphomicrobiaceae bacterium]
MRELGPMTWVDRSQEEKVNDRLVAARAHGEWTERTTTRKAVFAGLALAASLVVAVFAGDIWLALLSDHRTASGEQARVMLPDGSTAWLNTDSAIGIDYSGKQRRIDLLRGEAYFAVSSNPHVPFVVSAGGHLTRAVGTAFAVRDKSSQVSVTVTEGRIEVLPEGSSSREKKAAGNVQAIADQQVIYRSDGSAMSVKAVDSNMILAWRNGKIVFDDVSFESAIAELDRYRPGRILIAPTVAANKLVSGVFSPASLDSAIGTLAAMQGLSVRNVTPYLTILH